MLNEYVIKFGCKYCKKRIIRVYTCGGSIAIMKAALKNPEKCKNCDKTDWEVLGILNVDVSENEN